MDTEGTIIFDFTDPQAENRVKAARNHIASLKIDWDSKYDRAKDPQVKVENLAGANPDVVERLELVASKVGKALGLFESQSEASSLPVWEPKITIPTQESFDISQEQTNETRAYTKDGAIFLNPKILAPEKDYELNTDLYKNVLGEGVEENSEEVLILNRLLASQSVAHELYHIRQKSILFWRELRGPNKRKDIEGPNRYSFIEEQYKYKEEERGARSFGIRFLTEERKNIDPGSKDYEVLRKLVDHLVKIEKQIAGERRYFGNLKRQSLSNK